MLDKLSFINPPNKNTDNFKNVNGYYFPHPFPLMKS